MIGRNCNLQDAAPAPVIYAPDPVPKAKAKANRAIFGTDERTAASCLHHAVQVLHGYTDNMCKFSAYLCVLHLTRQRLDAKKAAKAFRPALQRMPCRWTLRGIQILQAVCFGISPTICSIENVQGDIWIHVLIPNENMQVYVACIIDVYIGVYMYVCMNVCMYVCICTYIYIYLCMYMCVYVCMYVCTGMHACVGVCVYIYL